MYPFQSSQSKYPAFAFNPSEPLRVCMEREKWLRMKAGRGAGKRNQHIRAEGPHPTLALASSKPHVANGLKRPVLHAHQVKAETARKG